MYRYRTYIQYITKESKIFNLAAAIMKKKSLLFFCTIRGDIKYFYFFCKTEGYFLQKEYNTRKKLAFVFIYICYCELV